MVLQENLFYTKFPTSLLKLKKSNRYREKDSTIMYFNSKHFFCDQSFNVHQNVQHKLFEFWSL